MIPHDFEKLGVFYLGREVDPGSGKVGSRPLLYDAGDLTTHAVIIGMTGSGKTGLGIGLLEEAAIDHVPVIAIDPKGDLGNLLLTFPDLAASDFRPWVDPHAAAGAGRTVDEYAADQAALWRKGLADWGQDGTRIQHLRDSAEFALYTPGSNAGLPVSVLRSFTAPAAAMRDDADLYRDHVQAAATGILTLLGIDADPLTSREHILVASILQHAWDGGRDLDLPALIGAIQQPPFDRVGVMDIESFFPGRDRFALATRVNNLLAAPGFDVWMQGEPLDAGRLFHSAAGRPRVSVLSIAHLGDAERMFFVTMLLNEVVSWMRRQPGTGSLRAILYMDEIFGYLPPTANPPSKKLFLTLLKQARAYGLGVVLATQNPVDLDYKALSNTGTWFIGRLQTERDKARVMEGLEGVTTGAGFDRGRMERLIAGLGKRRFLFHSVHADEPLVFATRWAMSYLAGPMTRDQIRLLCAGAAAAVPAPAAAAPVAAMPAAAVDSVAPLLDPAVPRFYLPATRRGGDGEALVYQPWLIGSAAVVWHSSRYQVDHSATITVLTPITDGPVAVDWHQGMDLGLDAGDLAGEAVDGAGHAPLPAAAGRPDSYRDWEQAFRHWLREERALTLYHCPALKALSSAGESEGGFRARLQVLARERRDREVGKLRHRYEKQVATLTDRLRRAEARIDTERSQAQQSRLDTAIAVGGALLGAFLGRRRVSATAAGRIGSAVRRAGRMGKEADDIAHAEAEADAIRQRLAELESAFEADVERLDDSFDAATVELQAIAVKARSSDIDVRLLALAWAPCQQAADGSMRPAWT